MKPTRIVAAALVALVVVVATACGSSSSSVPAEDVAVVDGTPVTKAQLEGLIARAKATYKTQKRAFPKAGTAEYQSLQTQAVAYLVQRAEYDNRGEDLKLTVTDKEINDRIEQVKKQSFGGSQAKFAKQLKDQGYTTESLRTEIRAQLLSEKIYDSVTKDAKVSDAAIAKYYKENKAQYSQAESRDVRHILVKTKAQANDIYDQLKAGASFAALAKKYSQDPGSKDNGGKLDDHPRPDGRPVRHHGLPALDQYDLAAGQDAVRLPRDPADLRHQAGQGDPVEGREAGDPGNAPRQGEDGRDHQVDERHQGVLRQEGQLRDRIRPASPGDRHVGHHHRLTPCRNRVTSVSPRRSSTFKS